MHNVEDMWVGLSSHGTRRGPYNIIWQAGYAKLGHVCGPVRGVCGAIVGDNGVSYY